MAKESLADRIKAGPLLPKWKAIVAKNKEISDLKGDIDGSLASYDKNLQTAADATKGLQSAWNDLVKSNMETQKATSEIFTAHQSAFEKLQRSGSDQGNKLFSQAMKQAATDVAAAMDTISKFDDSVDNFVQQANELYKSMMDTRQKREDAFKKAYDDARKQVDTQQAAQKKLEDDCNKIDDDVRKTITDMQKQAIKANKDKLADAMGAFLKQM